MSQRRVVTGTRDGREMIVRDELIEALQPPEPEITLIWTTDEIPTLPNDGSALPSVSSRADINFPGPGGLLVGTLRLPPESSLPVDDAEVGHGSDSPGYHHTRSVEVYVVLEGEIGLEVEDGSIVTLKQGEWFVKNGTGHAWRNESSSPGLVLCIVYGAEVAP